MGVQNESPFMELKESTKTIDECKNILFEDPKLRYFFEVSVPAARTRKETMGHILFVSPDSVTKECFITLLKSFMTDINIQATTLLPDLRPGDLGAMFTNLTPNDILLIENEKLTIDPECVEILNNVMEHYYLDLTIGKGPSARSVRLDVSQFTAVVCVEKSSKALMGLINQFEYIIRIDAENLPKLCKAKIKAECPRQITDESCEYISYKAKHNVRTAVIYLKRVLEYLEIKKIEATITRDLVEEIFDMAGVGVTFEEDIDDDEILNVFKEIRSSLRDIQEDVHAMRGNIEDFIAANGGEWQ